MKQKIDPDAPAHPSLSYDYDSEGNVYQYTPSEAAGMTIRTHLAGQALTAMLCSDECQRQLEVAIRNKVRDGEDRRRVARELMARRAVLQADALIAELNKAE